MNARILPVMVLGGIMCAWSQGTLTIMTYNIHHAEGTDGRLDVQRIADIVGLEAPDVVCLQEVDQGLARTEGIDMPAMLAERLAMPVVFGGNYDFDGGHYGNAILTRLPVEKHENFRLPGPGGSEPRGCLHVVVSLDGRSITILNAHLGLDADERREQASAILEHLGEGDSVLAGDLNATPASSLLEILGTMFQDTAPPGGGESPTYPTNLGGKRIDYVLVTRGLHVHSSHVVDTKAARAASDHLPYVTTISLGAPAETLEDKGIVSNEDQRVKDALLQEREDGQ